MPNKIEVTHVTQQDNNLRLYINETIDDLDLKPSGRMLVDSDSLAFVYILENEDNFTYVSLPSSIWEDLKKVINGELRTVLLLGEKEIVLEGIIEELQYLISNIEGNANYGEEMVGKVEEVFVKAQ